MPFVHEENFASLVNLLTLFVPVSMEEGAEEASLFFEVINDIMFSVFELINFVKISILELINFVSPS